MKRRITIEQLRELTEGQKQKLIALWNPTGGDCLFVPTETQHKNTDCDKINTINEDVIGCIGSFAFDKNELYYPEFGNDNDFVFKKIDCLPLLDIGQMIELLQRIDGDGLKTKWYIPLAFIDHKLCDALWKAVKTML
jgi:hypothetical protein